MLLFSLLTSASNKKLLGATERPGVISPVKDGYGEPHRLDAGIIHICRSRSRNPARCTGKHSMGSPNSGKGKHKKHAPRSIKHNRGEGSRLVVVSVDGLRADFVRRPDDFKLKIPGLRKLIKEGASAEGVESVFPSTTYPAHTTLVTGVPPRVHGIYSHLDSRDPSATARPWHWFARAIKVPTLWDAARDAG